MASSENSSTTTTTGEGEEEINRLAVELGKTLKPGERLLGPTRRPDGTLRKAFKIKAGFTPQDEVAIYKSKGALWKKEMESQDGPPGYDPEMESKSQPKSKSVKRNERKKEKKEQAALDRAKTSKHSADEEHEGTEYGEEPTLKAESLDYVASQMNQLGLSSTSAVGKVPSNSEGSNTANPAVDIDKKIRALKKKIRLAEAQVQKASSEQVKAEQMEKAKKLEGWREELKLMENEKGRNPRALKIVLDL